MATIRAIVNSQENACSKSSNRKLIAMGHKRTWNLQSIGTYLDELDQLFDKFLGDRGAGNASTTISPAQVLDLDPDPIGALPAAIFREPGNPVSLM